MAKFTDGFLCRDSKLSSYSKEIVFFWKVARKELSLNHFSEWSCQDSCTCKQWTVEEFIALYGKEHLPRRRTITPYQLEL